MSTSGSRVRSNELYAQAQQSIPGGVNSPVRAFNGVGGAPVFFNRGVGPHLWDEDDNRYIDYVGSWGPMIMGHGFAPVVDAVTAQAQTALGFGAPTALEIDMAELLVARVPSIEQVRLVNSGTEATMSAIRLARGATGRDKILKFAGCYHGHADSLLVKAGSGVLTLGIPNSPGVPDAVAEFTLTVPYNNPEAVSEVFAKFGQDIACVIIEPVAGNMGCIPPLPGFLEHLRNVTSEYGSLLIFDEVMTGFRVAPAGAQELYGITPDLTTLGKVIGGGLPVGAFGGRADIMQHIAPTGPVYQAGTLSGNPLAVVAGKALLTALTPEIYRGLENTTKQLVAGLAERAASHNIPVTLNHVCGMFGLFFTNEADQPINNFDDVTTTNVDRFKQFFHAMLDRGIYLAPSAFEAGFISSAHDANSIQETLDAADQVFAALK